MKNLLTLTIMLLSFNGYGQTVIQTKSQWTKSLDSIKTVSVKQSNDSAKKFIADFEKRFTYFNKQNFDSLNNFSLYVKQLQDSVKILRTANATLLTQFNGLNSAVYKSMGNLTGRLDSSIVADRATIAMLTGLINDLADVPQVDLSPIKQMIDALNIKMAADKSELQKALTDVKKTIPIISYPTNL